MALTSLKSQAQRRSKQNHLA